MWGVWTAAASSSPIEEVLDQSSFTVEDVLAHEDVLGECKSHNQKLIPFLAQPSTLSALVGYVVQENSGTASGPHYTAQRKFPYIASELFACEVPEILAALLTTPDSTPGLLACFFGFLDRPTPPLAGDAAYFCKVLLILLDCTHKREFIAYMRSTNQLPKLLGFLSVRGVLEALVKLCGAATKPDAYEQMLAHDPRPSFPAPCQHPGGVARGRGRRAGVAVVGDPGTGRAHPRRARARRHLAGGRGGKE
jgi:hypothetical protein